MLATDTFRYRSADLTMLNALGPIELVVLQGTSFCNLNCRYCYLTEASRKARGAMPLDALATAFTRLLESRYVGPTLQVSWHSGEPLVLGTDYYHDAIRIVRELGRSLCPEMLIRFDVQTNATLIDASWCAFFLEHRDVLSVGVSCDGPDFLHDAHRHTWAGKPTHRQTKRGMDLLRDHGIPFDVTAVVSDEGLDHPRQFLDFFRPYAPHVGQFHFNLLDEFQRHATDGDAGERRAEKYRQFLQALLKSRTAGDGLVIRNFTHFFDRVFAEPGAAEHLSARSMSHPFKTINVDIAGNVSTFYAGLTDNDCEDIYGDGRGLSIGNLLTERLDDIAASSKLRRIADDFERSHRACEQGCEYAPLCSGGYNLVKHKRYGTFDATETPECQVHVKTFAHVMLHDIRRHIEAPETPRPSQVPAMEASDVRPMSVSSKARTVTDSSS